MNMWIITLIMFGSMLLFLASGLPLSFSLGGVAAVCTYFFWGATSLHTIAANMINLIRSTLMVAVPLFVILAYLLEYTGVADELFTTFYKIFGRLKGGLAVAVIFSCTIIAAMTGISTTGVLLMGVIALPAMLKRGYNEELAMGVIMAGGSLGPLIPPSLVLIVYSLISGQSTGELFLAGVVPGIITSILFTAFVLIKCYLNPKLAPSLKEEELVNFKEKIISLKGILLPLLLVISVLGAIFFGVATPTEAAAIGAFGALLITLLRKRLNKKMMMNVSVATLKTVGAVMWAIFGANCFSNIYQGIGATKFIREAIEASGAEVWMVLLIMQIIWFILGCMMDSLSILMVTMPIFMPLAELFHWNLVWFGLVFLLNTEMGYLTPPFGVNLIVMSGIVKDRKIPMIKIYRAVWPFVGIQAIVLLLVILVPYLVTWVQ